MSGDVDMRTDDERKEDWVRLVSHDGFSFMVKRKVASVSGTLRNMLDTSGNFKEAMTNTCEVNERGAVVEKICEYMSFRTQYESAPSKEDIPVNEFMERIPAEIALELLSAADYLEL